MLEDYEGIASSIEGCGKENQALSFAEIEYVNECVDESNITTLVDRIDELSPNRPPKAINSNEELANIIEPISDRIDKKYLEAPSDLEQINSISDFMSGMENLKYEKWKELTLDEKYELLHEAEYKIAEIEHREPCEIRLEKLPENQFGYFSPIDKTITLNSKYVEDVDFESYKETLDTLIHEGRHAYQDYNMTEREVHPRGGEVSNWKWNENVIGYQDANLCGFKAYAMQPVETDARAFAEDVLNKMGLA